MEKLIKSSWDDQAMIAASCLLFLWLCLLLAGDGALRSALPQFNYVPFRSLYPHFRCSLKTQAAQKWRREPLEVRGLFFAVGRPELHALCLSAERKECRAADRAAGPAYRSYHDWTIAPQWAWITKDFPKMNHQNAWHHQSDLTGHGWYNRFVDLTGWPCWDFVF